MANGYSGRDFKRSLVKYVSGRAANAVASFAIFLWIAKVLSVDQYAVYIAAYSLLEIMLVVSGLGMEWVTAQYIPVARVKASSSALNLLVGRCVVIQGGSLMLGALAFYGFSPALSAYFGISNAQEAMRLYAIVMFIEGSNRVVRDQMLSVLMLQGAAQACQIVRNLTLLALAAAAFRYPELRNAKTLALLECAASSVSLALGAGWLVKSLCANRHKAADEGWERPTLCEMVAVGRDAWIGNLANLTWGPQVVILLVAKVAGAESTALLGFARNFSDYIRRYMPLEFLLGMIRTYIVVRYVTEQNITRLVARLSMAYKANLLFLMPFIAVVLVDGNSLLAAVGHGEFDDARWLVFGWLLVNVAWGHHRVSDILAHTLQQSSVMRTVSLYLIGTPLLVFMAMYLIDWRYFYVVLTVAEIVYCSVVVYQVNRSTPSYRFDWQAMAKFAVALLIAVIALHFANFGNSGLEIACSLLLATTVSWISVILLRAWNEDEAAIIAEMRNRPVVKVRI